MRELQRDIRSRKEPQSTTQQAPGYQSHGGSQGTPWAGGPPMVARANGYSKFGPQSGPKSYAMGGKSVKKGGKIGVKINGKIDGKIDG